MILCAIVESCGTAQDGAPLTLKSYTYVEFGSQMETAHRLIKGMLAEVGIDMQRETVEGSKLWATGEKRHRIARNFDLDLWDDGYYGVDPTLYLTDYFDPRAIPTRDNPVAG